ncbi:hypothetical protein CAPTEDRAFT_134424 [Capitella teleta]|uniref:C2H2-type domain-containing protein n=1 Tax=Capitella teleta TaxID=283909 RepID=R7T5S5_CAPTE|nr:hypothetical protein CAPTEDRAFT_134424 [Capitella teleta]|eukprot:ELT88734.1 hypothetical protein CAPTEDRAFT_134424 [Capitella teleta]
MRYSCNWPGCDKIFDRPARIKRHLLVHTGERPYKCEFCAHATTQKVHLIAHMKTRHHDYCLGHSQ